MGIWKAGKGEEGCRIENSLFVTEEIECKIKRKEFKGEMRELKGWH